MNTSALLSADKMDNGAAVALLNDRMLSAPRELLYRNTNEINVIPVSPLN